MSMSLNIQIEVDKRIEEILISQLGKNDWKLGCKNSLFKERSLEERYAIEEHQNIESNN
jgi:hypothetical protein